ncbi:SLBB domain-containing protein [Alloacidobacterium sp.]|uniref:SLBB domain-containing protein n=1 Tax=Alloacidobacterium sp. TaxID=2951999 RepID=UPI002D23BE25|nr:SLBB domain-containing protein [Alloacidobacterium sp.]HYK37559.1 SLBB domain-containing protein [Alloacidobacterium sp.]
MRKRLALSLFFSLLAAVPHAHSQITSGEPTQDQGESATDCSDPVNAMSAACSSNLGQQGQYGLGNYGQPGYGQTGERNVPAGAPLNTRTYTDLGNATSAYANANRYVLPTTVPGPPEPLTEFQKFVAGTTGEVLPIFGASLFRNVPSTFAPVEQIPVTPDYIIGPDDELRIRVWGQVNFNADVRVDRSGSVYLPQIGAIHVAGLPFSALGQHLRSEIGRVFRNFDLTVDAGQLRSIQVFVVGQARRPGSYTVSSLSSLVNALFASGGPSTQGSLRHILLKRQGKTITDFDLYDLLINGDKSKDAQLLPGDVIFIPPAGPQVALTGSVRHPAIYELHDDSTTLQQLLADAGGASTTASDSRISIERIQNHSAREAMEVSFDATGLATTLRDGDVLRVLSIVPRYQKTVTLRGNTANPGHFAWHEGMKLSDLIPDRDSLVTRDYYWRRAQLGLPTPEFQPYVSGPVEYQPSSSIDLQSRQAYQQWQLQNRMQRLPNGQYVFVNPQGTQGQPGQTVPNQQNSPVNQYPYAQGNVYLQGEPQYSILLPSTGQQQATDLGGTSASGTTAQQPQQQQQQSPGQVPSGPAILNPSQMASSGSLAGRQTQIITQNTESAFRKNDVKLSAPEIDWNYAVIDRTDPVTLKTSLIPFNLGKLVLEHDPSQNLTLDPGDVVTIFSQADIRVPVAQQTKFVRLEGEFVNSGIYSVLPGETLRQLIVRAGGLTPGAYLYGSEFNRESTRVLQQQRIDEYVQNLELEIQRGAIAGVASSVNAQDVAAANAAATGSRELLNRLHQLRATGRIVLHLNPDSVGVDSLPDLSLEDGDVFMVPPAPATVNVVGAVYDQNSFMYLPNHRVGDYLKTAGGPGRDADKKHMFIIRADGSVISKTTANGLWGNTFEAARMNPGDTVVVPEKTFRPTALRGLLDWSQLFSQLALGVAAVSVI